MTTTAPPPSNKETRAPATKYATCGSGKSALENLFAACVDLDRKEGREIDGKGGGGGGGGRLGVQQVSRLDTGRTGGGGEV